MNHASRDDNNQKDFVITKSILKRNQQSRIDDGQPRLNKAVTQILSKSSLKTIASIVQHRRLILLLPVETGHAPYAPDATLNGNDSQSSRKRYLRRFK
jgi:hypothetical protein